MALSLSNSVADSAAVAINAAQRKLQRSGEAIGRGIKNPITSITSYILGSSLSNEAAVLESVLKGTAYGTNLLNVAMNSLQSMQEALVQQLKIIVEADTPGAQQLAKLQGTFNTLTAAVTRIANNAQFDGRDLLSGELSSTAQVRNAFATVAIDQKTDSPVIGVGNALINGIGTRGTSTITIGTAAGNTNVVANDSITVGTSIFTFLAAGVAAPAGQIAVAIGATAAASAQNLAAAIENASSAGDLALKHYEVTISGAPNNVVTITNVSKGANAPTPLVTVANTPANFLVANNAGNANQIDLRLTNSNSFIGTITPNFQAINQVASAGGNNQANVFMLNNGGAAFGAPANGDLAAEYSCTIGGETYKGVMGVANAGAGNTNGAVLTMKSTTTNSQFTLTLDAGSATAISSLANANLIATQINTWFAGVTFSQTQYLQIDTSAGSITSGGSTIGSTTGLVASLNTTDFSNLTFDDFSIDTTGLAAGNVNFTAKIAGKNFLAQNVALTTLVQGFGLNLTEAVSGDVLTLNLGTGGLTAMTSPSAMSAVVQAYKNALGIGKGLEIRVGSANTDNISVQVDNVTAASLYLDSTGAYQQNLDITSQAGRTQADQVIRNALDKISSTIASVGSQVSNLELASDAAQNSRLVQQDAANGYLGTDYEDEVGNYTELLNRIQAAIATIIKSAAVSQAVLNLINNG
jgi:flagellin-like hook-associated protein FlgL